jgi:DNA-binding SARP family transcriptional activator
VTAVSFRLLGPLEVAVGESVVPLGGVKPRTLLTSLLLEAGVIVSTDFLVDVLWPNQPPRSAAANVRTYVHFLRRTLAEHGAGPDRIESRSAGYLLRASPEEIDAAVFEARVERAREALAAGDREAALALLVGADALWRGGVLADLPHAHPWGPAVARLAELRLSAREQRTRIRVELGRNAEAVVELRGLLADTPLREELWAQLVIALDADGRRAEALSAYVEAERVLRAELNAEPGLRLRRIRSSLASTPDPATDAVTAPVAPVCRLPLDLPDFTGRHACMAELVGLLRERGDVGLPAVAVLSGLPGVGKSAVAIRVAHELREDYPGGQLYVDLGGTSPNPRAPMAVLAELLGALGIPNAALPRTLPDRAGLLRSRLASARVLVVLDDAADAAQVRPLLPGAGASAVLVSSRQRLPDLAGAHSVELDVLPLDEAAGLLAGIVGAARVTAEPDGATTILECCGYLPLAIRVVGAKLAYRPQWALRMYARRLSDEHRRLDELRVGDLAVRASVNLSYDQLPGSAARALRGLGTLGPVQFPGWLVGALLDRSEADDVLDALVDAHLVDLVNSDEGGQPRYRLHDLLRVYAVEQAVADPRPVRVSAVRRVLEGYLDLALEAARRLAVDFFGVLVAPREPGWRAPRVDELLADPASWFAAERATGVAAVALAAEWGLDGLAWRLAAAFTPYFDLRGLHEDWLRSHQVALAAARGSDDVLGQAVILRNLGQLHLYQDAYDEAKSCFEAAHHRFVDSGEDRGAAIALAGAGTVLRVRGDRDAALERSRAAQALFARAGDRHGEAVVLLAIGSVHLDQGEEAVAERHFTEALALAEAIGDRHRQAHARHRLAVLHQHRGDLAAARAQLDRAIAIFDELGDDHCVGYAHQTLGELYLRGGDLPHAQLLLANALTVHRRNGDRRSQAEVAESLGELHHDLGRPEQARTHFDSALAIWRELSATEREAELTARLHRTESALPPRGIPGRGYPRILPSA